MDEHAPRLQYGRQIVTRSFFHPSGRAWVVADFAPGELGDNRQRWILTSVLMWQDQHPALARCQDILEIKPKIHIHWHGWQTRQPPRYRIGDRFRTQPLRWQELHSPEVDFEIVIVVEPEPFNLPERLYLARTLDLDDEYYQVYEESDVPRS